MQLGLFAQHDNAERMMHSAQAKGFSASVSDKDAKGLYHVQVGNLSDHATAQAMQGRLRDRALPRPWCRRAREPESEAAASATVT